ncbi:MAG: type II secretion system F family protein [Chloroflexi bacterium]|nr:type II secretion system F family protein [Chloroflexota bacterium]
MIPVLLSVAMAGGVYLTFDGLTRPRPTAVEAERRRWGQIADFLTRAGVHDVGPHEFVAAALATGLLSALVAQLVLGWGVLSGVAGLTGLIAPYAYYLRRHDRRRSAVQTAVVEAIEQVRDAIRTGLSVPEALAGLGRTGPEVLRPEFARLSRELRLVGFASALTAMRDRLADPVFDVVAAALTINDRLGGHQVSQVLDRLAEATRAQLRVQDELRAQQGRTVLSARIVALAPVLALVGLRITNPRYLAIFDSWVGQVVLVGCVFAVAIGYLAMLALTRLPGQRRVLVR